MIDFEINDKGTLVWNDGSSRPATHQEQELSYEITYRDNQIKELQAEVERLKSELAIPKGYVALPSDPDKVAQTGLYWLREHHNADCAMEWGDFCAMWADIVERHAKEQAND